MHGVEVCALLAPFGELLKWGHEMKRFAWLKLAVAAVAAAGLLSTMAPPEAAAQGLFPGLFGGGGGGRGGGMKTGRRDGRFSPTYGLGRTRLSYAA